MSIKNAARAAAEAAAKNAARAAAEAAAKTNASSSNVSGGPAWLPAALKVGAVLVTVVLAAAGGGDAAEAAEALSEFGRK